MNVAEPLHLLGLQCPIPIGDYPHVLMAHGGGGRLSQMLVERMFAPVFDNPALEVLHDGALLSVGGARLAFSTDSFVVSPLFFPGGDIGSLAIYGTVNDLAMCGARPLGLSVGLIIEEGLAMETLWQIVQSMQAAARRAGVSIVTGDTKVVERGKGDGIYINTSGVGLVAPDVELAPRRARAGDRVLISGVDRHARHCDHVGAGWAGL
jgi:hydrogenase expression/formation protein HypE